MFPSLSSGSSGVQLTDSRGKGSAGAFRYCEHGSSFGTRRAQLVTELESHTCDGLEFQGIPWPNKSLEPTASAPFADYIVACYSFALPQPCQSPEAVAQLWR